MMKITHLFAFLLTAIGYAQPTTNAPAPTRSAADVFAIYNSSNTYTNNFTDLNPNWGQSGFGSNNIAFTNGGTISPVINYANFNYQGINIVPDGNPPGVNVAGMEYIHLDIWSASLTSVRLVPIQNAGPEEGFAIAITSPGTWISVDIPVTAFPATNFGGIRQFKFDTAVPANGLSFFVDNIYFWKTPLAPGSDATLNDLKVDGVTVPGFGPGVVNYTYELVVGTTTIPQITMATTTDVNATRVITQATSIPGNATVVVTSQNGNVNSTYTVSFVATIPNQAPIPSTPPTEVLKIYGDTGGFTNVWVPDYSFGGFQSILDLDSGTGVNEAIKMNFEAQGYGQGTNPGTVTNVSAYGYLNFSYYVQSGAANAGSLGHQFYFDLISRIGTTNTESFYGIGPALSTTGTPSEHVKKVIVFDSWQTVSIPLSDFVGFSPANFFQFKIGTSSDLRTKIAYFDDIYFSVNPGTVLSSNNFNISKVKLYPNPTSNILNIESVGNIQNISVYNVLGQEVLNREINDTSFQLDVASLNAGVYVVKTNIDGNVSSTKFIKE